MFSVIREFRNEKGKTVQLTVTTSSVGVTVNVYSETINVDHVYTHREADVLFELLNNARTNSVEPNA